MEFSTDVVQLFNVDGKERAEWFASCGRPGGIKLSILCIGGVADAPNPGARPRLVEAIPQGINPKILILNLIYDQSPGIWPQVITPKPVGFTKGLIDCDRYDSILITDPGVSIEITKY